MSLPFPEPTDPRDSRTAVLLGYLDYFRSALLNRLREMPVGDLSRSRVASGWTPLELAKHLTYVERRWLEWGFEGRTVDDPWGDEVDGRWHVEPHEDLDVLTAALQARGELTRSIVQAHALEEVGQPGPRWDGAAPPTLERVLYHLVQEYARHVGQLDIVAELAGGPTGE